MQYINYNKNDLSRISIEILKKSLPDLKNVNKTDAIYKWLSSWIDEAIAEKVISVGNLLPTKAELAYCLGVSLGTIQNVLKQLEDNDYIYSKQRIGSVIKDKSDVVSKIRKRTSKKDIAEDKIKKIIVSSYKVGQKLPSSRELASEVNMTLNTVRSALSKLVSDGIIEYNSKKEMVIKSSDCDVIISEEESLVDKIKSDLKVYINKNFKIGDKLPSHGKLAKEFNVSQKTVHNAIQSLVKENMLLPRRGSYGTIIINTSLSSAFEPRREMSIFAPAQETAFYHYQKIQNKIKNIISQNYDIGSKIPSIRELSEFLDVSPNIIRKALNNLAKEGILRFARGRYGGTYVIDMPEVAEQTFRWLAVNPQYAKVEANL